MTDDLPESGSQPAAETSPVLPGQRLQQARVQRGLSQEQVAAELRLPLRFVQALESDDYRQLPEPAFVRGYMRRYAQLVKISADEVAGIFDQSYAGEQAAPALLTRASNPVQLLGELTRPRSWKKPLLWVVLAVLVIMALLLWRTSGQVSRSTLPPANPAPASALPLTPMPVTSVPATAPAPMAPSAATTSPVPSAPRSTASPITSPVMSILPAPRADQPATGAIAPTPASRPALSQVQLDLTAPSWVSLSDARGPLLASGIKPAGRIVLQGQPPFHLNLGNAPAVRLTVNGRVFDLAPHTRAAVADVTVRP